MAEHDGDTTAGSATAKAGALPATVEAHDFTPQRPGRPSWTREQFIQHFREAQAATHPPHTNERIAANLRRLDGLWGIEPDSLRRLKRRFRT